MNEPVDLGEDHWFHWSWADSQRWEVLPGAPTRLLEEREVVVVGITEYHRMPGAGAPNGPPGIFVDREAGWCGGGAHFARPLHPSVREQSYPVWDVRSWDPLHIEPSLACTNCPSHGFIRDGRWVNA